MTLSKKPEVGESVMFIAESAEYLTNGKVYKIVSYDEDGDPVFYDDHGEQAFVTAYSFGNFEIASTYERTGIMTVLEIDEEELEEYGFAVVEVQVTREGHDRLRLLATQNEKAEQREELQEQIDALQKKMREL